ncbi:MAG TPA: transposase [Candidatus Dojkabacteria bacterium]|nr:transposase [Candidatus Dojkabacteria bacterium]
MPEKEKLSTWVRQMVWGGVSWHGKTDLIFIEGWVNNVKYIDLLKAARPSILRLFPEEFHFVQDNARCHVHKNSLKYIRRWLTWDIKDHPPQSPDLNPIELVWAQLKKLVERKRPKNKEQLRAAILTS